MEPTPLPAAGGFRIEGVDLARPLAAAEAAELRDLFANHGLLVFPGQDLTPDQQVDAVSNFGPVVDEFGIGNALMVSNLDPEAFLPMTEKLYFHSDRIYTEFPLSALSLYGEEVSADVTPTRFVNLGDAFQRLPDDLKRRVTLLTAVDMADYRVANEPDLRPLRSRLPDGEMLETDFPRRVHPVVLTHPVTFTPKLFVGEFTTVWIEGLPRDESNALLEQLFAVLYDEAFVYTHHWQAGDLVLWDNLAFQHGREALTAVERRSLRRVTIGYQGFRQFFAGLGETRLTADA